jgi:hypothetical protein
MQPASGSTGSPPPLLQQVRDLTRALHLSIRTEEAYVRWIAQRSHYNRPSGLAQPRSGDPLPSQSPTDPPAKPRVQRSPSSVSPQRGDPQDVIPAQAGI